MKHFAPMFELDDSIFCVSAFNHLSYPHTAKDPTLVYRVKSYPAYGWMMSREKVEYIVPKFLPDKIDQDWDYFIGSELIMNKMEILIPDINRSYHWAIGGVHNKGSLGAEEAYLSRTINRKTNVSYMALDSLTKTNYESKFSEEVKLAEVVSLNNDFTNFSIPLQKGKYYKLYIRLHNTSDLAGFQIIAEMLHIWYNDIRDHHNYAWKLNYMDAILFIIGVPLSPY
ncbi:Protein O-linked-mannose beta-1,2-N-acetylglucosaminyltransferase 1, partial [Armadillidium vulgare]